MLDSTSAAVQKQVRAGLRKSDYEEEIDLSGLDVLMDVLPAELEPIALDGGLAGLVSIGMQEESDIVNVVSEAAVKYARERAAEMVGKRWVDGVLVDNPNAEWRIDEPTRDGIRDIIAQGLEDNIGRDEIADLIGDSYWFSEERSQLIADTEVTMANQEGVLDSGKAAKAAGVDIVKEWYPDEDPCPECQENADQGSIEVDEEFSSGDETAPAHPRCECVILFRKRDEEDGSEEDTEE